tara:strand:- start:59946 stop:63005 length:3060 start_codon:yes stop_codon:yes gene_type:complete
MSITSFGQNILINTTTDWVNHNTPYQVSIDSFEGNLLNHFSIKKVSLRQNNQLLVDAHDIDIRWEFRALFFKRVSIDAIQIKQLIIDEQFQKQLSTQEPKPDHKSAQNQDKFTVDNFAVPLRINAISVSVVKANKIFDIQGNIDLENKIINLSVLDTLKNTLLSLRTKSKENLVQLNLKLNEQTPYLLDELNLFESTDYPIVLNIKADVQYQNNLALIIDSATGTYRQIPIDISGKIYASKHNKISLDNIIAHYNTGLIQIKGDYEKDHINITGNIKNIPIPDVQHDQIKLSQGILLGEFSAQGSIKDPAIQSVLQLDAKADHPEYFKNNNLLLKAKLNVKNKNISANADLFLNSLLAVNVQADSPFPDISSFELNEYLLNTQIKVLSNLSHILSVKEQDNSKVDGILDARFNLKGKIKQPIISGTVDINQLNYENTTQNIFLTEASIKTKIKNTKHISIEDISGNINGGTLKGQGLYTPTHQSLKLLVDNVSTSILEKMPIDIQNGIISGVVDFSGTAEKPNLNINVKLQDFNIDGISEYKTPFNFNTTAITQNNLLKIHAVLLNNQNIISEIQADTSWPQLILYPQKQQLSGKVKSETNLEVINRLLSNNRTAITGSLVTDLSFSGSSNQPNMVGFLRLSNVEIKDQPTGLTLKNISLNAVAKDNKIVIKELSATDSKTGNMNFKGFFDIGNPNPQIWLTGDMHEMHLLNSDAYDGIANGQLAIKGNLLTPLISGNITWQSLNITIPDSLPANIPEINVISKKAYTVKQQKAYHQATTENIAPARLDLNIDFPKRIFLRGKGLDAELGGKLHISGAASQPKVDGQLKLLRGKFTFLNKNFTLQKGNVRIEGDDIDLDFQAATTANDITAIIKVTGTPDNAKIKISSVPSLPQDEIIAKIMFGSSLSSLSPFQKIQLALALKDLASSGKSGGRLDLLGKTREILKVDDLDIVNTESGASITAGKYLLDNVYLKAEQGASAESSKVTIQIDVSDNFSVESSTGTGETNNNIKLFWRKNY